MIATEQRRRSVTYRKGQVVAFPRSPSGTAQVDDLLTRRVVVAYYRRGKLCRRPVHVRRLTAVQDCHQMLPGFPEPDANPLGRGIVCGGRSKTYQFEER